MDSRIGMLEGGNRCFKYPGMCPSAEGPSRIPPITSAGEINRWRAQQDLKQGLGGHVHTLLPQELHHIFCLSLGETSRRGCPPEENQLESVVIALSSCSIYTCRQSMWLLRLSLFASTPISLLLKICPRSIVRELKSVSYQS